MSNCALDGLPKQFVVAMRTLFDIMDDKRTGFVRFAGMRRLFFGYVAAVAGKKVVGAWPIALFLCSNACVLRFVFAPGFYLFWKLRGLLLFIF